MARTRNDDHEVRSAAGKLGNAIRDGHKEAAEEFRDELHKAKIMAAAKKVAAQLPELTPEQRERVRALLGA